MKPRTGIIVFICLIAFFMYQRFTPHDLNAWKAKTDTGMAYSMAKDWVVPKLKAPSTAKFPTGFEVRKDKHVTYLGNHTYRVNSWVDSHNGFGANIRTKWYAVVEQTGEYKWTLKSLTFDKR